MVEEIDVLVAALLTVESTTATELAERVGFEVGPEYVRELHEHGIVTLVGDVLHVCPIPATGKASA